MADEEIGDRGAIVDPGANDRHTGRHRLFVPSREIVENRDGVAGIGESANRMAADVTGAAGDYYSRHQRPMEKYVKPSCFISSR